MAKPRTSQEGSESLQVKHDMFKISFQTTTPQPFDSKYTFALSDGKPAQQYHLVHFGSLAEIAAKHGLKVVEIVNLQDFYQTFKLLYKPKLRELNVLGRDGKLSDHQTAVIGLYASFVLQKDAAT